MNLTMKVGRLSHPHLDPYFNPIEAIICLSEKDGFARHVSFVSDDRGQFSAEEVAAALRLFADTLTAQQQVPA